MSNVSKKESEKELEEEKRKKKEEEKSEKESEKEKELEKEKLKEEKRKKKEEKYINSVWKGAKDIYKSGLVEFGEGNVSVRVRRRKEMYITPTSNDYETLTKKEIVHIGFDGTQISKGRPASSEYRLHAAIYKARKKAKCVIHTHSIYACILSAAKQKIPVVLEEMLLFLGGEIQISDYSQAGNDEIGENVVKVMGETNGVLMTDHGVVVCGKNMQSTVKNAKLVEKLAHIYWGAAQLGEVHTVERKYWKKFLDYYKGMYSTAPRKRNK